MTVHYAVLGATGSTGSELVKNLLKRSDAHLNIYARSEDKLKSKIPELSNAANQDKVGIFTGSLDSPSTLTPCLRGVTAIFSTIAQNYNEPGCRVARNAAEAIVGALEGLRKESSAAQEPFVAPRLVWLSSASLNAAATARQPWLAHKFIYNASWYVYEDLRAAEAWMAREAPWLPLIRACPGGLIKIEPQGVSIADADTGMRSPTISYSDLAGGMIMMAEDPDVDWAGQQVSLDAHGEPRLDLLFRENIVKCLFPGTVTSFVPAMFPVFQKIGVF